MGRCWRLKVAMDMTARGALPFAVLSLALVGCIPHYDDFKGAVDTAAADQLPSADQTDRRGGDATADAVLFDARGNDIGVPDSLWPPDHGGLDLLDAEGEEPSPPCAQEPFEFGCPCEGNPQCASGYCLQGRKTALCTQTCVDECPDGWDCQLTDDFEGGDPMYVCVAHEIGACAPCVNDEDCGDSCDFDPDDAGFPTTIGRLPTVEGRRCTGCAHRWR